MPPHSFVADHKNIQRNVMVPQFVIIIYPAAYFFPRINSIDLKICLFEYHLFLGPEGIIEIMNNLWEYP